MKKLVVFMLLLASCECEEIYYNNDFTSGELTMATQNLITTSYPPTWTVEAAQAGYGFGYGTNVLKSGHGLLYYTNLGGTLTDQATALELWFELALQESGTDRTQESFVTPTGQSSGTDHLEITNYSPLKIGDIVSFANYPTIEYTIVDLPGSPDVYLDRNLEEKVDIDEQMYLLSANNDIGCALFHNITESEEYGLVLAFHSFSSKESTPDPMKYFRLYVYKLGVYYPAKYKDGANYRTNAGWILDTSSSYENVKNYALKLTSNRYLKLFENADLIELTADSLGANVTTVDIQNVYYGDGNTQYVPDAGGFYVGVSSGAYDRVQTAGRYSYLDNLRVKQ